MAEWTKEDKEAFRRKDAQQAKGYSVEQAIKILASRLNVDDVLEVAEKVLNHTAPNMAAPTSGVNTGEKQQKSSDMSPKAQKVFERLVEEYSKVGAVDVVKLEKAILTQYGKLPTLLKSVKIVMKEIKPEDIMIGD